MNSPEKQSFEHRKTGYGSQHLTVTVQWGNPHPGLSLFPKGEGEIIPASSLMTK